RAQNFFCMSRRNIRTANQRDSLRHARRFVAITPCKYFYTLTIMDARSFARPYSSDPGCSTIPISKKPRDDAVFGEQKIFLCALFHICVLRRRRVRSNIMLVP
ncbi:hypothetical protein, partial [Alicyclobacillus mali (ex Roth et al. 2021)]|uniref:hypothetical protein n=1 Tax=Alicyclobacillus mali (ex Roth et al. 2021) TaxID=1123961 RepID=UPI001E34B9F6